MTTTSKKDLLIDRPSILSEKAFVLYNERLDEFGTARKGFLPINELRRVGNWLAGGPGTLLSPIDFVWLNCVQHTKPIREFFSDRLQDVVAKKIEEDKHFKPHEVVCRETVFKGRPPEEVLLEMGTSKESVELKLRVEQLDEEILDFLVHVDGEMEQCRFCPDTAPRFQPVEAFVIKYENFLATGVNRNVEDALFVLRNGQRATTGSFVIGRQPIDRGYKLVANPFHGHHFYYFRDDELMIGEVRDNMTKGHLGRARKAAYLQKNAQLINGRKFHPNLDPTLGRKSAQNEIDTFNQSKAEAHTSEVSKKMMEEVFPPSRLPGGLGATASKG